MKKYFLKQSMKVSVSDIARGDIVSYRQLLMIEMEKMGATDMDKTLLCDELIINSIKNKRKPEDVAWAILQ